MKLSKIVYLPLTADLFHIGHLRAIKQCAQKGLVIVGLLDDPSYKEYVVPYEQRREILEEIKDVHFIVRQESINPIENLKIIKPHYVASGDGFEPEELKAIKQVRAKILKLKYCREQSTTKLKQKICQKF